MHIDVAQRATPLEKARMGKLSTDMPDTKRVGVCVQASQDFTGVGKYTYLDAGPVKVAQRPAVAGGKTSQIWPRRLSARASETIVRAMPFKLSGRKKLLVTKRIFATRQTLVSESLSASHRRCLRVIIALYDSF